MIICNNLNKNILYNDLFKSLPTSIELTTDSNGSADSDPIGVLHPNKNIMGVIINYNYQTNYGGNHAIHVYYYPPTPNGGKICIANDTLINTAITIFYTVLYTDMVD